MSTQAQPNEKLKAAREARGWTQEYVALSLQVDLRNYRRWESGRTQPALHNLEKLCRLLRKTKEEIGF